MLGVVVCLALLGVTMDSGEGTILLNRHEQGQVHPCLWILVYKKPPRNGMTTAMPSTSTAGDGVNTAVMPDAVTTVTTEATAVTTEAAAVSTEAAAVSTEAPDVPTDASDTTEETTEEITEPPTK